MANLVLRLLALLLILGALVIARLMPAPGLEPWHASAGYSRVVHSLGFLGGGVLPWLFASGAVHLVLAATQPDPSAPGARRLRLGLGICGGLFLAALAGQFLWMWTAATFPQAGFAPPGRGAVVFAIVLGTALAIAAATLISSLQLCDGALTVFLVDMSVLGVREASTALEWGLLLGGGLVATAVVGAALTRYREVKLQRDKDVVTARLPLLIAGAIPIGGGAFLAAVPTQFAGMIFQAGMTAQWAIWIGVFVLGTGFFTFFFVALSWSPMAAVDHDLRVNGAEAGKPSAQALEAELNRLAAWNAPLLAILPAIPFALSVFAGVYVGALGLLPFLLAPFLVDLGRAARWRAAHPDPIALTRTDKLPQALRLERALTQAGVPCQVTSLGGWILLGDFGPRAFGTQVWVSADHAAAAHDVLAAVEAQPGFDLGFVLRQDAETVEA